VQAFSTGEFTVYFTYTEIRFGDGGIRKNDGSTRNSGNGSSVFG
jgi:hypothetical protein